MISALDVTIMSQRKMAAQSLPNQPQTAKKNNFLFAIMVNDLFGVHCEEKNALQQWKTSTVKAADLGSGSSQRIQS